MVPGTSSTSQAGRLATGRLARQEGMYCTLHYLYVMILQVTNNNCIFNNVGRTFTCNILCVRYVPVLQVVVRGIPKKVDKENVTSLESVFIRHI